MRTTLLHDAARAEARRRLTSAIDGAVNSRAAIRDATVAMLHGIPGLSGMRHVHGPSGIASSDTMTIGVTGWSPTLHAVRMSESVKVPHDDEGVEKVVEFTARLCATLSERARDAAAAGMRAPADATTRPPVADHLVIDRSLAEIHLGSPGACIAAGVASALRATHGQQVTFGGYVHGDGGRAAERVRDPDAAMEREIGWAVSLGGHGSTTYDGVVLSLKAEALPVTITQAMRGRPLRDLVRPHPALDDRIVRELHVDDLGGPSLYTATFEPDTVPLRDWIR